MDKPIYIQIKEQILHMIEELPANTLIPGEREIALKYGASRMTVRKAIQELVDDGILYRLISKGTFVADRKFWKSANTTPILSETQPHLTNKILYFDIKTDLPKDVLKHLEADEEEWILRVVRLIEQHNSVICIEELYCARRNITDEDLGELNKFLDIDRYVKEGNVKQIFHAMLVPTKYAQLLHLKIDTPIIQIDSTIHKKNGEPFIFIKSYNHPTKRQIEITL